MTPTPNDDPTSPGHHPIACPGCGAQARLAEVSGIVVDRCDSCGGVWLDALELDKIRATPGAAARIDPRSAPADSPPARAALCPRDRSTLIAMTDHHQPHVRFESCTVCGGIFLNAGELRNLADFTFLERLRSLLPR